MELVEHLLGKRMQRVGSRGTLDVTSALARQEHRIYQI